MNRELFGSGAKIAVQRAFRLAWELGQDSVDSGHVLWALTQGESAAAGVLRKAGLTGALIREVLEKSDKRGTPGHAQYMFVSADAARVWESAEEQLEKLGHKQVEPEHLLLAMLGTSDCAAERVIQSTGARAEQITERLLEQMGTTWPAGQVREQGKGTGTETLAKYSYNLTQAAVEGRLDPVIGRQSEIERVIQILSRRTKNNPVLVGEPGVGKTAIAEGLAQSIVAGDVPDELAGKQVVSLDLTKMLAGTKFRGDFEERIKSSIEEASANGNIILFIDEMHTLIGAGSSEGSMDAANILKPALSRGEIQLVGATTMDEYRKHIEKDAALERRFQPVQVEEPSPEDALAILRGLRERYELHHRLTIDDEALEAAVKLSERYIQDRYLPDKAIDLMDEAASRVRTHRRPPSQESKEVERRIEALEGEKQESVRCQDFERAALLRDQQEQLRRELAGLRDGVKMRVTPEDVAAVVSMWTGVPVTMLTEDESRRLLRLEETLHQRVIGQDEAVGAVARAIRRSRVGIKDPKRPMGAFLFLGPTGVGKTELCKALAEAMFQDEDAMLRIDMSEFMEQHSGAKLIGSPPGYVGYDEGGQLTEQVRRKPYSVILFDEIEKAHRDVWNILLQIMEDGRLTDAQGRHVSFKNAIIVMTSNIGARNITDKPVSFGFQTGAPHGDTRPVAEIRDKVMKDLKDTFRPEFLNRIDDIIVFHQLDKENIRAIAGGMVDRLEERMRELEVGLRVEESALELLADKGFDPLYGARPLRRVIQSELEDQMAELLLQTPHRGGTIHVAAGDGEFRIRYDEETPATQAPAQEAVAAQA